MRHWFLTLLVMLAALPAFAAPAPARTTSANLTILADEQMLLPLAQIARDYATHTRTPITIVLKNTTDAARQIEQGLEAHLVVTADKTLIDRLTEQGLADVSSRRRVAGTQLALVTASPLSKQALVAKRISFAAMLAATPQLPVFTNDAQSYEGARTQALLNNPEFAALLAARVRPLANHEEVLESLRDSDGIALMLAASATAEPDMHILALLPDDISPFIAFEVVVLGSESMGESAQFASYLSSRAAQDIFARLGFQPGVK